MTYREKIQQMISQIDQLYNESEWLRDMATGDEKVFWNAHRRIFFDAANPLRKLDDSLIDASANRCIHETGIVITTKKEQVTCNNCDEKFYLVEQHCVGCKKEFKYHQCDNCMATYPEIID